LIAGLAKRGLRVHVFTRAEVGRDVEAAGGTFCDLFAKYPVEAVDSVSMPLPSRLVTFAAAYADPLTADVARLRPALLVYDSFVVVAPLIGQRLAIPYVGMRAGHAQVPARAVAEMRRDPRVVTSAACLAAVETLRTAHGMTDASPFSYLQGVSPYLNLYPEPAPFLDEEAGRAFQPMAFFGSLAPDIRNAASRQPSFSGERGRTRVYMSFGTVIWKYHAEVALAAMATLAGALTERGAEVLVSLGRYPAGDSERRRIERPHVRVERYVDQWGALKEADLFVTHHGLNSTHEAIFHQVPMLSYPFLGDQPAMARCCEALGLAVPLAKTPRAALDAADVQRSIATILSQRAAFADRLAEARRWELDTIEGRDAVLDRMLALT
jgi:MGT family glycosyltransferase